MNKNFKTTAANANSNAAMETETIQKNGVSPKDSIVSRESKNNIDEKQLTPEEIGRCVDVDKYNDILKKVETNEQHSLSCNEKERIRQKASDIINEHTAEFRKIDSSIIVTEADDFRVINQAIFFNQEGVDPVFYKIFTIKAPIQKSVKKSFFHYKSFDFVKEWISGEYITLSALSNFADINNGDDIKEYKHFFDITMKCCMKKDMIESRKEELYVLCLTENNTDEWFWKKYDKNNDGVCLEIEIIDKMSEQSELYSLNKICYDNGNDFQFLSDIQCEIYSECEKKLIPPGHTKFAALYKRKDQFELEKETRLLIDWSTEYVNRLESFCNPYISNGKKYLKIPFNNPLFNIKLKSITFGKNISPSKIREMEELLAKHGIRQMQRLCIYM
jgi:hypothetical protein